jgi:hypothetical protein
VVVEVEETLGLLETVMVELEVLESLFLNTLLHTQLQ